jgi:hypothetical protein
MLAVVESLRLFLDKTEMSSRLQVAMLIDREIFKRAIIKKGTENGMMGTNDNKSRFFREQEEKLFVASLQLTQLNPHHVSDLAVKFIYGQYRQQLMEEIRILKEKEQLATPTKTGAETAFKPEGHGERAVPTHDHEEAKVKVSADPAGQAGAKSDVDDVTAKRHQAEEELRKAGGLLASKQLQTPTGEESVLDVQFTPGERTLLKETLEELNAFELTPRSIRAFVLRYQLVRLLLQKVKPRPKPNQVITALAARLFPGSEVDSKNISPQIQAAIAMVAAEDTNEEAMKLKKSVSSQDE